MNRRTQDRTLLLAGFAVCVVILLEAGRIGWALIEPWF